MQKRDLAAWEKEYRGRTAEEGARRVIVRYRPSEEELSGCREAGQRRGAVEGRVGTVVRIRMEMHRRFKTQTSLATLVRAQHRSIGYHKCSL